MRDGAICDNGTEEGEEMSIYIERDIYNETVTWRTICRLMRRPLYCSAVWDPTMGEVQQGYKGGGAGLLR